MNKPFNKSPVPPFRKRGEYEPPVSAQLVRGSPELIPRAVNQYVENVTSR